MSGARSVNDARRVRQLWVEVKAVGGRPTPEQLIFAGHCALADVGHVIGGVDEVIAWLIRGWWLLEQNVPHYRRPADAPKE